MREEHRTIEDKRIYDGAYELYVLHFITITQLSEMLTGIFREYIERKTEGEKK